MDIITTSAGDPSSLRYLGVAPNRRHFQLKSARWALEWLRANDLGDMTLWFNGEQCRVSDFKLATLGAIDPLADDVRVGYYDPEHHLLRSGTLLGVVEDRIRWNMHALGACE